MLNLFRPSAPLLPEDTIQWLYDCYAWVLRNFDQKFFYSQTMLVTPTNKHFPGTVNSAERMAETVFEHVKEYAGMQNWPLTPLPHGDVGRLGNISEVKINNALRGDDCQLSVLGEIDFIPIGYDPQEARQPDRLIAHYANQLASHLSQAIGESAPDADQHHEHAVDILSICMGFGIFLANNAINLAGGGCSGCGKSTQVFGSLMEEEMLYALAIFCALKGIKASEVVPHLKPNLRPFCKKALKEVNANKERWAGLLPG